MFYLLNTGQNDDDTKSTIVGAPKQQENDIGKTTYTDSVLQRGPTSNSLTSHLGKITKNEFMKIFEVYELWKYES